MAKVILLALAFFLVMFSASVVAVNDTYIYAPTLFSIVIPYCGDGICQNNETYDNCPQDCVAPGGGGGGLRRKFVNETGREYLFFKDLLITVFANNYLYAGNNYVLNLESKYLGEYTNLDVEPEITVYNPILIKIYSDNMTNTRIGKYNFVLMSNTMLMDGEYPVIIKIQFENQTRVIHEWFIVESAPTKLDIEVVDNSLPNLACNIYIENEGEYAQEYTYRYWITSKSDGGFFDSEQRKESSLRLNPGQNITITASFLENLENTYFCKVIVDFGSRISAASKEFKTSMLDFDILNRLNEKINIIYLFIFLVIILFVAMYFVSSYKKMVRYRNKKEER